MSLQWRQKTSSITIGIDIRIWFVHLHLYCSHLELLFVGGVQIKFTIYYQESIIIKNWSINIAPKMSLAFAHPVFFNLHSHEITSCKMALPFKTSKRPTKIGKLFFTPPKTDMSPQKWCLERTNWNIFFQNGFLRVAPSLMLKDFIPTKQTRPFFKLYTLIYFSLKDEQKTPWSFCFSKRKPTKSIHQNLRNTISQSINSTHWINLFSFPFSVRIAQMQVQHSCWIPWFFFY